jgi:hypothetical protein
LPVSDDVFCENWCVALPLHCIVVAVPRRLVAPPIRKDVGIELKEFRIIFLEIFEEFRIFCCQLRKLKKMAMAFVWGPGMS